MGNFQPKILKQGRDVLVTHISPRVVQKAVLAPQKSRLSRKVSAEEMVERETLALEFLEDIPRIPRLIEIISPRVFTLEYLEGTPFLQTPGLTDDYFTEILQILKQCEQKGVYRISHARRDFLAHEGKPQIVDFGNILFVEDPIARIPGLLTAVRAYNFSRVQQLRMEYIQKEARTIMSEYASR